MRLKHRKRHFLHWFHEPKPTITSGLIPLSTLKQGDEFIIHEFRGCKRFANRLLAMGLSPGVKLTVFKRNIGGQFIIEVNANRIALGGGETAKVWVEKV